jgi:nicotinic acid mononucleotide adenylyltransferase
MVSRFSHPGNHRRVEPVAGPCARYDALGLMDPFDLATLFAHRSVLRDLDPEGLPTLVAFTPLARPRSVALLPGSFNPPTAAHLLLAERAIREGYDCVVFVLAKRTAGKEQTGLTSEDRLMAMRVLCDGAHLVAACSHGLYAEQAEAAAQAFPGAEVVFLVGSDKVLQIFDPDWYRDRDSEIEQLFERARLVVAPRADQTDALRDCLAANPRWGDRVTVLRLHPAVSDLSSTHVRGLIRSGADPNGLVPPAVAAYLQAVHAFAPAARIGSEEIDAYEVRARLIDGLWALDGSMPPSVDLEGLTSIALSDSADGRALRAALQHGEHGALARVVDAVR